MAAEQVEGAVAMAEAELGLGSAEVEAVLAPVLAPDGRRSSPSKL